MSYPIRRNVFIHPTKTVLKLMPDAIGGIEMKFRKEFSIVNPNPFNPKTVIRYQLPVNSRVMLKIYDLLGQEIETLIDEFQDAGHKSVEWSTVNMPSGVYLYRLVAGSFSETKKVILLR